VKIFWNKDCHQALSSGYSTFQEYGATAHHLQNTVAFLHAHVPALTEREKWPPNSPDLKPVDYFICGHYSSLSTAAQPRCGASEGRFGNMLGINHPGFY